MIGLARRSFVIYAMAYAVAGVTPFFLLPILTQRLTPQEFGEASLFTVFYGMIVSLAGLNAQGFVAARYYKSVSGDFARVVSTSLVTIMIAHALALGVLAVASFWLTQRFGLRANFVLLSAPTALLASVGLICLAIYQFSNRPWDYLRMRFAQAIAEILLCVVLLWLLWQDANARVVSCLGALAIVAVGGLWHLRRMGLLDAIWRPALAYDLLKFGVPMLPHVCAGIVVTYADRLIISSLMGSESVGLYMAAMQVGMVMLVLIEPMNRTLAPWLFGELAKNDPEVRRRVIVRTYQLFAGLALVGLVLAVVLWWLFVPLVGSRFVAARTLVPWLVAGYVCQGMYYCVVNYLFYAEATSRLAVATGTAALFSAAVSFSAISVFGLDGAGAAFVVNNLVLLCVVWLLAARTVPMPWRIWRQHEPS